MCCVLVAITRLTLILIRLMFCRKSQQNLHSKIFSWLQIAAANTFLLG
uniref:G-protein coupled receptors family 1 profile domain-containing protein n=1 Tax=Anguilla anguilla TaxID=7936 RepID=A0A0E9UMK7_ANGAN